MSAEATAYLVMRQGEGYGEILPLVPGQRYTLGRSAANNLVLKDDLCSREHAEVSYSDDGWHVRDLTSLNGTKVNGQRIDTDTELAPHDTVLVGRSHLVFVEDLDQLPGIPVAPSDGTMSIRKRLGQTRFLTPQRDDESTTSGVHGDGTGPHGLSRDLALLYRLALDMGSASSYEELVKIVLTALLEAIPAEVGAVLSVPAGEGKARPGRGQELTLTAFRHRDPARKDAYIRVSEYVSNEVLNSREAVLAEDVSRDRYLRNRESLTDLGATSLICAPVAYGDRVSALIHLYCTDPHKALTPEDLEFTVAVAKQLGNVVYHLQRQESLSSEVRLLKDALRLESELVGQSAAIKDVEKQVALVAPTNATCLIRGESGSGKELVARAVHYSSPRRDGPFVTLNCAALTETLLESELFGHEKGSFTGATEKKIGKFEAADRGTIFLDEIGEMNVGTQAKLLRILEGHPYERVGGSVPIRVDVRVVAATNQPLEQAVHAGTFRRDLFFRLQVVQFDVPPLRERVSDIPLLAEHFLKRFVRETGRKIRGFTPAAMAKLQGYHWPGNVRELRNVVERAVALGAGPMVDTKDVWLSSLDAGRPPLSEPSQGYRPLTLEDLEKEHIADTLQHTDWNKSQAAAILRIERSTLDRKIKLYDLKR